MLGGAAQRRLTVWIASLALLLAALAPALSQTLGTASPRSWVEVCTATGSAWVDAETGAMQPDGSRPLPAQHLLDHCPCCSLHVSALGLPPTVDLLVPAPGLPALLPPGFLPAPHSAPVWVSAQPRAPPRSLA